MKRKSLPDGTWFNVDAAELFEEKMKWDGRNMIPVSTGDQWLHEDLYRTRSGKWVLHCWSQWQGSKPTWEIVSHDVAAAWLVRNGHYVDDRSIQEEIRNLEI